MAKKIINFFLQVTWLGIWSGQVSDLCLASWEMWWIVSL